MSHSRVLYRLILPFLCAAALLMPCPARSGERDSIVPPEARISDFEARLALARLLSYREATLEEALAEYRTLLEGKPGDSLLRLEFARILMQKKHYGEAKRQLERVLGERPDDPDVLAELADLEALLGHAARCRDLYEEALALSKEREALSLRLADRMNMWGDFYRVESIYRDYLGAHPGEEAVRLKLAEVLSSSQRYEEAEGLYRMILFEGRSRGEALMGLARLKVQEKDFASALSLAERLPGLRETPDKESGLLLPEKPLSSPENQPPLMQEGVYLRGEILAGLKRYGEALEDYARLAALPSLRVRGWIGVGRMSLAEGRKKEAREAFSRALAVSPLDPEARFLVAGEERATSLDFLRDLLNGEKTTAMELAGWAGVYASHGFNGQAVACCEKAVDLDPECFPALLGLAEILGVDRQYDRSLALFGTLREAFPTNVKVLLSRARVLGWSKRYDESIEAYEEIHRLNPIDPVPRKEMARTAAWGKRMDRAQEIYRDLFDPPVDMRLLGLLADWESGHGKAGLKEFRERVRQAANGVAPYKGYEAFSEVLPEVLARLDGDGGRELERIRLQLLSDYRIQKAAFLEGRAKWMGWNRRFSPALDTYEALIAFQPGNEEAVFDKAQAQCALGLCDREAETYRGLLDMDPLHSLAASALQRQEIRNRASLRWDQAYWEEEGRGDLARIARHRTDLTLDIPLSCQYRLRLVGHRWNEDPKDRGEDQEAYGQSIKWSGVLNPYVRGAVGWTRKEYRDSALDDTDTGFVHVGFNLGDLARIGIGYDRTDELYNIFGLRQGIQADRSWLELASHLTRRLEILARAEDIDYSDDNEGHLYSVALGYAFTDHPRIFKITGKGEYRDTDEENIYHYRGSELLDITHPYWTPEDYHATSITFEWVHDLSRLFVCGSQLHTYDIRLAFGTDSEDNASVNLEGEWHWEFRDRWTAEIRGTLHRSEEWDAEGVELSLQYRF
ncbi:MAG: tetratricopeptide repeat protein [Deltaproteobacteria bacterium]|nr:tetratricopeptide repeat protein [Deltaproteobacteria bacterium]